MKVFFDALGCPKALVDAEKMCYELERNSHSIVPVPEEAEAIVINTCGFIDSAKQENIDTILAYAGLKKENRFLKIIVAGCLSERYREDLLKAIPEIDNAIGVRDPSKIIEALNAPSHQGRLLDEGSYNEESIGGRSLYFSGLNYSYLKISEGCSRSCSFCAIPAIRGTLRSRKIGSIIEEAALLSGSGVRELIIISEDTISYGIDLYKKHALADLLKELLMLDFSWIRIMYLFPEPEILKVAEFISKEKRICNYIDMPLQHASGSVLSRMKRNGNSEAYLKLIKRLRTINPELRMRSSFITGYPGENEKEHDELKVFLGNAGLERVGFFEYSDEDDTASKMEGPKVREKDRKRRLGELVKIQERVSREKLLGMVNSELICINDGITVREKGRDYLLVRSEYDAPEIDGYIRIETNGPDMIDKDFIKVRISGVLEGHDLTGEPAGE